METRTLPADPAGIAAAARLLRQGQVVAFPTETVYGLGGLASRVDAVRGIFLAKGRPSTDPLILHLPFPDLTRAAAEGWVAHPVPAAAIQLAQAFWPGPLTLILQRGPKVHPEITAGLDTVAVRCPSHPASQKLLQEVGAPLAAPSANRFGRISPTDARAVQEELEGKIPLILDGGPCAVGLESTVVNLVSPSPEILRPGAITPEQVARVSGQPTAFHRNLTSAKKAQSSPGQLPSHYAPQTPLYLCDSALNHFHPQAFHLLFRSRNLPSQKNFLQLGQEGGPDSVARELYRALRTADASGSQLILVEAVPDSPWAEAIRDRLLRASTGTAAWTGQGWQLCQRRGA
jgi:L-threonylcarbamoyladenylate synthase